MNEAEARATFNLNPALYDEMRPGYPASVLGGIRDFAMLGESASVLEVGPGTGQASDFFIRGGYKFTGVDLGNALVDFANAKYIDFPNARFHHSRFEDWNDLGDAYDLVLGAQCFHWLEPIPAIEKSAMLLRSGGTLALMWNTDQSQGTEFFLRSTPVHDRFRSVSDALQPGSSEGWFTRYAAVVRAHVDYQEPEVIEADWTAAFTADRWLRLRCTYSDDALLAPLDRKALHDELRAIIESMGGTITMQYRTLCLLARTW